MQGWCAHGKWINLLMTDQKNLKAVGIVLQVTSIYNVHVSRFPLSSCLHSWQRRRGETKHSKRSNNSLPMLPERHWRHERSWSTRESHLQGSAGGTGLRCSSTLMVMTIPFDTSTASVCWASGSRYHRGNQLQNLLIIKCECKVYDSCIIGDLSQEWNYDL